jgi:hypothetical protein
VTGDEICSAASEACVLSLPVARPVAGLASAFIRDIRGKDRHAASSGQHLVTPHS